MNDEQIFSRVAPRHFYVLSGNDVCVMCQQAIQPKEICVGCLDSDEIVHLDCLAAAEGEEN